MPAQRPAPDVKSLRKQISEHEALEQKLYEALISDHITKRTDIYGALWDYAESMSGCVPGEDDYGLYYDD